jgi:hypothetical protein
LVGLGGWLLVGYLVARALGGAAKDDESVSVDETDIIPPGAEGSADGGSLLAGRDRS